jgi:predicted nucleotide-binding protein
MVTFIKTKLIMAQRKDNTPPKPPDALIISKTDFKSKLLNRINIGKEIFDKTITNVAELEDHTQEYYKWDSYNSELLKNSFNNENNNYKHTYDQVNWSMFGGSNLPNERLADLKKDIKNKYNYLEELVDQIELIKSEVEKEEQVKTKETPTPTGPQIFIVHGHNVEILQKVARTLEKLKLKPIILHEQPNSGQTIIEKFEAHSNVGFAIVLLTDDDEGKSKVELDLQKRARQNVIMEMGFFIGKLGRSRVLPLYSKSVELPSDIHGLLYTPIDDSDSWMFKIAKELNAAGYSVDVNALL